MSYSSSSAIDFHANGFCSDNLYSLRVTSHRIPLALTKLINLITSTTFLSAIAKWKNPQWTWRVTYVIGYKWRRCSKYRKMPTAMHPRMNTFILGRFPSRWTISWTTSSDCFYCLFGIRAVCYIEWHSNGIKELGNSPVCFLLGIYLSCKHTWNCCLTQTTPLTVSGITLGSHVATTSKSLVFCLFFCDVLFFRRPVDVKFVPVIHMRIYLLSVTHKTMSVQERNFRLVY